MDTVKITLDDRVMCLSCGVDQEGAVVYSIDRPDLVGENCALCDRAVI